MDQDLDNYLDLLCKKVASDPQEDFSKKTFFKILKILPSIPNVPGAEVFYELARKSIPVAIDMVLIRNGKVLLVRRNDNFYDGWHFPGFYRKPYTTLLIDSQERIRDEVGGSINIISVRPIGYFDHPNNHRFHDFGILTLCEFEGEPLKGEWFSEMPKIIDIQKEYWKTIEQYLAQEPNKSPTS